MKKEQEQQALLAAEKLKEQAKNQAEPEAPQPQDIVPATLSIHLA